jgi:hypothetical protein
MKESKLDKTFSISVGEALVAGIVIAVVVACVVAAITTGNWWFLAPVVVLVLACALFAAYVFIYAAMLAYVLVSAIAAVLGLRPPSVRELFFHR